MKGYQCEKINRKTKIFYVDKPNKDLAKFVCQLFEKSNSLALSEEAGNAGSSPIKVIPTIRRFSKVYGLEYQSKQYIVKNFLTSTLEQNVSYLCKGSKAICSFNTARELTALNIRVPKPLFVLIYRVRPFKRESIYLTPKFNGPSLESFMIDNLVKSKEKVVKSLLNLSSNLGMLYQNHLIQTDPNPGNFLVDPDSCEITFIDVNSIRRVPALKIEQILRNLTIINGNLFRALAQNNLNYLYSSDRILFFLENLYKTYRLPIDLQQAFTLLSSKTAQYLIHEGQGSLINEWGDCFLKMFV